MLILCEKPSVAKDFAGTLGCTAGKGSYHGGTTVITWCVGHLFELCKPERYNPIYKVWDTASLPIVPQKFRYEANPRTAAQAATVLSLLKEHREDTIIIATDAGREGEFIARIVLAEAGITDRSRIKRFWASEALTGEIIRAGITATKPLDEYNLLALQGYARQRADWLIGINLTRLMSAGNMSLFSVGRVQTAVAQAVLDRNRAVKGFKPVPYQELEAVIRDENGKNIKAVLRNPDTGKPAFGIPAPYLDKAKEYCQNRPVDSINVKTLTKTEKPEKLFNLTALQKEAYKQFSYTPEKTLEIAQTLYEKYKCLSYPRTPSRVMGEHNVQLFKEKIELLSPGYPHYKGFIDLSLINASNRHIFNSQALEDHHALIPLAPLPQGVPEAEKNIYDMVVTSFFRVCMPDHLYDEKRLTIQAGTYIYTALIKEIVSEGWKAYSTAMTEIGRDTEVSDGFSAHHAILTSVKSVAKETMPPKEFSIDTLLSYMENPRNETGEKLEGLGTAATRAAIITLLFDRGYIIEQGRKLSVTEKGRFLLDTLNKDENLKKIACTAQTTAWEKQLQQDPLQFEKSIVEYITSCIKGVRKGVYRGDEIGKCPLCGNILIEGKNNYYCASSRTAAFCGFTVWKEIAGAKITRDDIKKLIRMHKTHLKQCVTKGGKKFAACFSLDPLGKIVFSFPEEQKKA